MSTPLDFAAVSLGTMHPGDVEIVAADRRTGKERYLRAWRGQGTGHAQDYLISDIAHLVVQHPREVVYARAMGRDGQWDDGWMRRTMARVKDHIRVRHLQPQVAGLDIMHVPSGSNMGYRGPSTKKCPSVDTIRKQIVELDGYEFARIIRRLHLHETGRLFASVPVNPQALSKRVIYVPFEEAFRIQHAGNYAHYIAWQAISHYLHGFLCGGSHASGKSHSWADFVGARFEKGPPGEIDRLVWGNGHVTYLHTA
jgi:hypothetical protein